MTYQSTKDVIQAKGNAKTSAIKLSIVETKPPNIIKGMVGNTSILGIKDISEVFPAIYKMRGVVSICVPMVVASISRKPKISGTEPSLSLTKGAMYMRASVAKNDN